MSNEHDKQIPALTVFLAWIDRNPSANVLTAAVNVLNVAVDAA
jgi:hypothetical protein